MRIDLQVPFKDKDRVKSLGGKWDPARKIWYVSDPSDLKPFSEWMGVTVNNFYKKSKK